MRSRYRHLAWLSILGAAIIGGLGALALDLSRPWAGVVSIVVLALTVPVLILANNVGLGIYPADGRKRLDGGEEKDPPHA